MRITSLVAALGIAVLFACAKDNARSADSAGPAESATAARPSATAPATPRWTDANIFALLDEVNVIDSAGGKLASTKGTNADVRGFGVMMMTDHHLLRKSGQDLATKLSVTPTPPPNDSFPMKGKAIADSMASMPKGPAWDKTYIGKEVAVHQQVLGFIDAFLGAAQAPELKDMLTKARSNIEAHLNRAQEIQGKLGAAAGT